MNEQTIDMRLQYFLERRLKEEDTINAMMRMNLVSLDKKKYCIELAFPIEGWQLNPAGNMHGGMICTALDITMGCVSYIFSDADFTPTIQMSVNFDASIHEHDTLIIEGICDHAGSRMVQARALARIKGSDTIVASANGSYAVNKKQ